MTNLLVFLLRRNTQVIAYYLRRTRNTDKVLRDLERKAQSGGGSRKRNEFSLHEKRENKEELNEEVPSKDSRQKSHLASQRLKFKNELRAGKYFKENPGAVKFLNEKDINKRIYKSPQLNDLLNLYHAHKFTFSVNNLVNLTIRYAKLFVQNTNKVRIYKKDKRLQTLLFNLEQNLAFFSPEEKILLLWSLAKINMVNDICEHIVKDVLEKMDKIRFKYLSLFLWTLTVSKQRNSQIFAKVSNHVCPLIQKSEITCAPPQVLPAGESTSSTKEMSEENEDEEEGEIYEEDVNDHDEDVKDNSTYKQGQTIEMKSLCLLLWAFGKSKMLDEELFKLFCNKVLEKNLISLMSFKSMSAVLYAFTNVNFFEKKSKDLMIAQILERSSKLEEESVLTLKTLLVLTAKEKNQDPHIKRKVLLTLSDTILSRHKKRPLSAKFLSEIVWWLAVCDIKEQETLSKIELNIRNIITEMNSRDLTYCFFAFAKYFKMEIEKKKNPYREILDILSERIISLRRTFNKRSLAMIKESYETSGYRHDAYKELFKS